MSESSQAVPQSDIRAREPIDVGVLARIVGDAPDLLRDLYAHFWSSASETAAALEEALHLHDLQGAGDCAHRLKGSGRSAGAIALGDLSMQLEQACRSKDEATIDALRQRVAAELLHVRGWIETRTRQGRG